MDKRAVVARFIDWNEAQMARGLLESNGIACRLGDSNMAATELGVALALGGIRLMVLDHADAPAAKLLLDDVKSGAMNRALDRIDATGTADDEDTERCPACASTDIFRARSPLSAVITALFSAPMLLPSKQRHCRKCGKEWVTT